MLLTVTEIRLSHKIQQILMVITDEELMAGSSSLIFPVLGISRRLRKLLFSKVLQKKFQHMKNVILSICKFKKAT